MSFDVTMIMSRSTQQEYIQMKLALLIIDIFKSFSPGKYSLILNERNHLK